MSIQNSLYSLTWGDYGTSLVSAVQLLRCHGDLVDVTLAAEGRSFEAHKIVLCAASPYLLNLLKVRTQHFLHISFICSSNDSNKCRLRSENSANGVVQNKAQKLMRASMSDIEHKKKSRRTVVNVKLSSPCVLRYFEKSFFSHFPSSPIHTDGPTKKR